MAGVQVYGANPPPYALSDRDGGRFPPFQQSRDYSFFQEVSADCQWLQPHKGRDAVAEFITVISPKNRTRCDM